MRNEREKIYSVTMTEEELRLFSEFLAAQKEQKEFGMIPRASHVSGMKDRTRVRGFNAPSKMLKPTSTVAKTTPVVNPVVKPGLA